MNKLVKSSVAAALALSATSASAASAGEMYASLGVGYAFGNYKITGSSSTVSTITTTATESTVLTPLNTNTSSVTTTVDEMGTVEGAATTAESSTEEIDLLDAAHAAAAALTPPTTPPTSITSTTSANILKNVKPRGFAGNLALGYYITDQIRTDLSFTFLPSNRGKVKDSAGNYTGNKASINQYYILANATYDIETGTAVTPYITAGLGAGMLRVKTTNSAGTSNTLSTKTVFAYQLGLGASYQVMSNMSLDLGYRFTGQSNTKYYSNGLKLTSNGDHSFLLTSRFTY